MPPPSPSTKHLSDASKILADQSSYGNYLAVSGLLSPLLYSALHSSPRIRSLSVSLLSALATPANTSFLLALVEQGCVPPLFIMSELAPPKYTPGRIFAERLLGCLRELAFGKAGEITATGRRLMNTLSLSGSNALRANVAGGLLLLTAGDARARRELVFPKGRGGGGGGGGADSSELEAVGLVDVVVSMIQVGRGGGGGAGVAGAR
jgi:hypothetical protein